MNSFILLSAGSGSRMQKSVEDKVLYELKNIPVFLYSIQAFEQSQQFQKYIIVYRDEKQKACMQSLLIKNDYDKLDVTFVKGGSSRQESVRLGLSVCSSTDVVAIHDSARPLIQPTLINALLTETQVNGSAVPVSFVTDTLIKIGDDNSKTDAKQTEIIDRSKIRAVQTPQMFSYQKILAAYDKVAADKVTITDDSSAYTHSKLHPFYVENQEPNPKITTKKDLDYILYLLNEHSTEY